MGKEAQENHIQQYLEPEEYGPLQELRAKLSWRWVFVAAAGGACVLTIALPQLVEDISHLLK